MVVDDDKDMRFTVKDSLKAMDPSYEIFEAESGEDCLRKVEGVMPDLILLDVMMPGIDGTETAIKIRENNKLKDIPILFLSAKTDNITKSMGSVVGSDFIEKPFDPEDLDRRIKENLKNGNV
ncbi:MAG: response regulator [Nanobdellota archaeon]